MSNYKNIDKNNKDKKYLYEYKSDTIGLAQIIQDIRKKEKNELIKKFNEFIDSFWVKIKSFQYYDPFPLEKLRKEYKEIKNKINNL